MAKTGGVVKRLSEKLKHQNMRHRHGVHARWSPTNRRDADYWMPDTTKPDTTTPRDGAVVTVLAAEDRGGLAWFKGGTKRVPYKPAAPANKARVQLAVAAWVYEAPRLIKVARG